MNKRLPSPSLTPFDAKVLGLLRPHINQYADGASTILTPRRDPTQKVAYSSTAPIQSEAPVCIPVAFAGGGFNLDPNKNPYEIGDVVDISLISPPTGTAPISYQWYIDGEARSTSETFSYTVASGDVRGKVGDFGEIYISLGLINPCGGALSTITTINVFDP